MLSTPLIVTPLWPSICKLMNSLEVFRIAGFYTDFSKKYSGGPLSIQLSQFKYYEHSASHYTTIITPKMPDKLTLLREFFFLIIFFFLLITFSGIFYETRRNTLHRSTFCHITFRIFWKLNIFICHYSSSRNNSKHMITYQLFQDHGNYIYIPVRSLYKLSQFVLSCLPRKFWPHFVFTLFIGNMR